MFAYADVYVYVQSFNLMRHGLLARHLKDVATACDGRCFDDCQSDPALILSSPSAVWSKGPG